ncbi:cuticle protein 16.8 [Trichonephila clavipes]|nr:cuticle protein 16.8 [Trichonephila clavipes]
MSAVTTCIPHQAAHMNEAMHMPEMVGDMNHRSRCRNEKCSALTNVQCTDCAVVLAALAVTAFANLHEPIHHHAPQPYKFGYSIKDHHGEQHREESGDGGHAVRGSYGFTDARGIRRQVHYVADHGGFRAQVKTNEPGTANQNPAAVHLISDAPYAHGGYAGAAGLGYGGIGYAGYGGLGNVGYGGLG